MQGRGYLYTQADQVNDTQKRNIQPDSVQSKQAEGHGRGQGPAAEPQRGNKLSFVFLLSFVKHTVTTYPRYFQTELNKYISIKMYS